MSYKKLECVCGRFLVGFEPDMPEFLNLELPPCRNCKTKVWIRGGKLFFEELGKPTTQGFDIHEKVA